MKKAIIIILAVAALIACLVIARWADQNTKVPASTPVTSDPTGATSTVKEPSSNTIPTPGDIENGLGWG